MAAAMPAEKVVAAAGTLMVAVAIDALPLCNSRGRL